MASAPSYKADGSAGAKIKLNGAVFDVEPNAGLVHQIAVSMMLNKRMGNHETKTRAEVSGGGKKPYAQKGTGNARHGSSREPQMRGGGTVWGPHKHSYRQGIPVRMKRKALCCLLTDRVRNDALCVVDGFGDPASPKTKPVADLVAKVNPEGRKALIISPEHNPGLVASARNLERVKVTTAAELNVLDVLGARRVIVIKDALSRLEERLA